MFCSPLLLLQFTSSEPNPPKCLLLQIFTEIQTMTESASELDRELTELTVRLLSLGQDLVTAKLRLEAAARAGWIAMARARYGSPLGAESVSMAR